MSFVGLAALPGLQTAVIQSTASGFEGSIHKSTKTKFKWALWGSLACLVIGGYFLFKHNTVFSICFLIAAIFFPFMESASIYLSYLTGKKLFKPEVIYSSLTQIISSIVIIITLFLTKNIIILILAYFLSNTILRIYYSFKTIKKYPPNKNESEKTIPFGKTLSLLEIVSTTADQIGKVLLFHFLGAIQLAIYSFAEMPTRQINSILRNLRLLAFPKIAARTPEDIQKTLLKKISKLFLFVIPIIIIYIFAAPYIFKFFFPQYLDSVFYSQLYILSLLAFPITIVTLSFEAQIMKKEVYKTSLFASISRIILILILLPFFGIIGLVVAYLLNQLLGAILSVYLFKKSCKQS